MQNAFKDIKPFDLVDKFAHLYMIGDVKSIEVKIEENSYVMSIEGKGEDGKYMIGEKNTARHYEYDDRPFVVQQPDGKKYLMLRKYIDELREKMEEFSKNS